VTTISPALVATLALRDDYPDGSCWAWVDSSDRRCAKPGERLCARHLKVAEARLAKRAAANARFVARRREAGAVRLPVAEAELAAVEAEYAALCPSSVEDTAVVNLSLARRLPSDARIQRLARLVTLRDRLAAEVAGLRAGLAS
jgi:hypothetical protein